MPGLNKVMIIGNLGRDPEVTYTQSGTAVAKITVATSETWNDKNSGEKREKTEWHRITVFGKQAETVGKYMAKGSQIYVEGKLQTSQYEKNGENRYSTEIIASTFQFLGGKKQAGQQQQNNFQAPQQQNNSGFQTPQQQPSGGFAPQGSSNGNQNFNNDHGFNGPPDDDIPF